MDQHSMKKRVHDIFTKLKIADKLDLKANKRNALIDFLSMVPEMIKNTDKRSHIIKGLKNTGLIDEKYGRYLDFNSILATCRRNLLVEEYMLYYNPFVELFGIFCQNGLITDNHFSLLTETRWEGQYTAQQVSLRNIVSDANV